MNPSAAEAIFHRLDREIWVVTAASGDRRGGLVATLVSQASIGPEAPRVVVSLAKQHQTWSLVEQGGAFGLHLIDARRPELAWRFGLASGREIDKFEGLAFRSGAAGAPILPDCPAWLDCRVLDRLDAGDRTIYLGEVLDADSDPSRPILTAARLLELATPEQKRRLDQAYQHDIQFQAAAMRARRSANPGRSRRDTDRMADG